MWGKKRTAICNNTFIYTRRSVGDFPPDSLNIQSAYCNVNSILAISPQMHIFNAKELIFARILTVAIFPLTTITRRG